MARLLSALTLLMLLAAALLVPSVRASFKVDASTESLVLEDDRDARQYDRTALLFASDEFVLVAYRRAQDDLFTPAGVAAVTSLHRAFERLDGVQGVLSLASANLFRSYKKPLAPFMAVAKQGTVHSPDVDLSLARQELTQHELYSGNIVSEDGRTAGLVVTLEAEPRSVEATREWLGRQSAVAAAIAAVTSETGAGKAAAEARLAGAREALEAYRPRWVEEENHRKRRRIEIISAIRRVVAERRAAGDDISVSGVPSIVVEMVEAIQKDLGTFTLLTVLFVFGFLALVFRRARWVLVPLIPTAATVLFTLGLMQLAGKQITVLTGNIPSLLLVLSIAHSIHFVVRWREDQVLNPGAPAGERALRVARGLVWPCLFTSLTTMVGFLSFWNAGSRPLIDFGFFMAIGVGLSFVLSFIALPGALAALPQRPDGTLERSARFVETVARASLAHPWRVAALSLALAVGGVVGVARLDVEARFIDYFSERSAIYQGLTYIDERLGGTSALEVVITGPPGAFGFRHPEHLDEVAKVSDWFKAKRADGTVGSVMSYVGLLDELRKLSDKVDRKGAAFMLGGFLDRAADDSALKTLLRGYVVLEPIQVEGRTYPPFSVVRVVARVRETKPGLRRIPLVEELRAFLKAEFPEGGALQATPTGMFVLYANMLETLMGSQVSSSVFCLVAIWAMLAALLRSPLAGALAMVPNLLPIAVAMGAMGWAGIPLDMATVMICSVSLGIGIDCAIHYLFRYEQELVKDGDVRAALLRTSGSIGTSIFYTSLTSVVGFAVLAFSEFRPNAYFGLLTGVAMIAALFAMNTLLPVLVEAVGLFRKRAAAKAAA